MFRVNPIKGPLTTVKPAPGITPRPPVIPGGTSPPQPKTEVITFYTSISHRPDKVSLHPHIFEVPMEDFPAILMNREARTYHTTVQNGNSHQVLLVWSNWRQSFIINKCDGKNLCWDIEKS